MLIVTNSLVVIILQSFFFIAYHRRGLRRYKSKNHICVMHYSKFEQETSAFIKVLTEWLLTRT